LGTSNYRNAAERGGQARRVAVHFALAGATNVRQSKQDRLNKARVDGAATFAVMNIAISVLDIQKVFDEAERLCAAGADDNAMRVGTRAFAQKLAKVRA
jgi:hypothetical protein